LASDKELGDLRRNDSNAQLSAHRTLDHYNQLALKTQSAMKETSQATVSRNFKNFSDFGT